MEEGHELVGFVAFLYAHFDPDAPESFPNTQQALSLQPMQTGANAAFIYNLAITPENRDLRLARMLYGAAAQTIVEAGCTYAVGAVRLPSYRGSQAYPEEEIALSPQLAEAVDRHLAGGSFPSQEEFCHDPLLVGIPERLNDRPPRLG